MIFKNWNEIRDWAESNGWKNLVARMELNNRCWESSGEFGRSQVQICDAIRYAESDDEQREIAEQLDNEFKTNCGLY